MNLNAPLCFKSMAFILPIYVNKSLLKKHLLNYSNTSWSLFLLLKRNTTNYCFI